MSLESLRAYIADTDSSWVGAWDENQHVWNVAHTAEITNAEWREAVTIKKRATAFWANVWYGIVANPMFWCGAAVFAVTMSALSQYGIAYSLMYYFRATVLSYILAPELPLKYFSSDAQGAMDPVTAGLRNSVRMFLPLLGSGLLGGKLAIGYSLAALVAVGVVEAGKHAVFHANGGYVFADRTMLVDLLERRLALVGVTLPVSITIVRMFHDRATDPMEVDIKAEGGTKTI